MGSVGVDKWLDFCLHLLPEDPPRGSEIILFISHAHSKS